MKNSNILSTKGEVCNMREKILMFIAIIMMLLVAITSLIGGGWLISILTGFTMLGATGVYTCIWVILVVLFFIFLTKEVE
jgi:hypothetical protein